jgi:sugar O-acyltransferase (sialic acid O-acetyltransferase NeuD family)
VSKRLVVVGGHGSGEMAMSIFEAVNELSNEWTIEGYLTDIRQPGEYLGQHSVLGGTDEVLDFVDRSYHVHYALHLNAKHKWDRVRLLQSLQIPDEAHATCVHPSAHVDPSVKVGRGVAIDALVGVSVNAIVGNHVHMYQHAFLNHESVLGEYVTVAPQAAIGARVTADEGAHIGLGASLREDTSVGRYAIVGMGAVVLDDVEPFQVVGGNPAREIGQIETP